MTEWKKARKKPVIVEFREVEPNDYIEQPVERIDTREGRLVAYPGKDYVIRGSKGEIYPIAKEIFEETYEVIECSLPFQKRNGLMIHDQA